MPDMAGTISHSWSQNIKKYCSWTQYHLNLATILHSRNIWKGFPGVSVHLGCYNRILQIGLLINNRNLFLMVLEAGKSKIKVPADSVSGEDPSWFRGNCLFCCVLTWQKGARELTGFSCIINPFDPHDLITSQRLQIPSHWGIGFNIWIWMGAQMFSL